MDNVRYGLLVGDVRSWQWVRSVGILELKQDVTINVVVRQDVDNLHTALIMTRGVLSNMVRPVGPVVLLKMVLVTRLTMARQTK